MQCIFRPWFETVTMSNLQSAFQNSIFFFKNTNSFTCSGLRLVLVADTTSPVVLSTNLNPNPYQNTGLTLYRVLPGCKILPSIFRYRYTDTALLHCIYHKKFLEYRWMLSNSNVVWLHPWKGMCYGFCEALAPLLFMNWTILAHYPVWNASLLNKKVIEILTL